ncbi:hypothetical protein PG984_007808 [Apiospora sp. TS-2023a]
MHFSRLTLSAVAIAASIASAMPPPGQDADVQNLVIGDDSGDDFGFCNGFSCRYELQNIHCGNGTSAKSRGGGDGKPCTVYDFGITGQGAYAICPGHEISGDGA